MRPLCDACESAAARVFCAADEAALCPSCDEKVHGCNKLASRHVRLALAEASAIRRCDICEKAPAFFYCGIDGTSLCLHCDMTVHVGGKRTHERFLLMGQRVELPSCKAEGLSGLKAEVTCLEGFAPGNLEHNGSNLELYESPHNKSESSNTSAMAVAIGSMSQNIDLNSGPLNELRGTSQSVESGEHMNGKAGHTLACHGPSKGKDQGQNIDIRP